MTKQAKETLVRRRSNFSRDSHACNRPPLIRMIVSDHQKMPQS